MAALVQAIFVLQRVMIIVIEDAWDEMLAEE